MTKIPFVSKEKVEEIAAKYPTPFHLYDEKGIRKNVENLKKAFHIEHSKRPYWIQGGEWPMGKNSPMQYISRSKIPDGVKYIFQDVDTGEIREIEQFY